MVIPFPALIFQGIPEQIALVTLAFVLAKLKLEWPKIILFAMVLTFTAYFIRYFSPTFGIHTIVLMGMLFIFFVERYNVPVIKSLKISVSVAVILIITESILLNSLMKLFSLSFEVLNENIIYRILITWPQVLILFLLSFIIIIWRRRKEKSNETF
ncbi:MAG TPA: hypothetical protein GXX46_03525 [Peptococcaceae bacterium]|nr:hypothetical protein [Peptococcaceae bacterium]